MVCIRTNRCGRAERVLKRAPGRVVGRLRPCTGARHDKQVARGRALEHVQTTLAKVPICLRGRVTCGSCCLCPPSAESRDKFVFLANDPTAAQGSIPNHLGHHNVPKAIQFDYVCHEGVVISVDAKTGLYCRLLTVTGNTLTILGCVLLGSAFMGLVPLELFAAGLSSGL